MKPFLRRVFTLQFTRKLILYGFGGLVFVLGVFFLLRFVPEKAFEFSSPYFGTIKTTALSASNYLSEIEMIRTRVEGQRDTIDAAFVNAAAAQRAASNATAEVTLAHNQLIILQTNADFLQLVAKSMSDDRDAYDQLIKISYLKDSPLNQAADNVVCSATEIAMADVNVWGKNIDFQWENFGVNPATNSLQDFKELYFSHPKEAPVRYFIVLQVFDDSRFSELERFDFLNMVLQQDKSIRVAEAACELMDAKAKMHRTVASANRYVEWFKTNRGAFHK